MKPFPRPAGKEAALLASALELSQHMLAACRSQDWALLSQLETRRRPLLEQAFSQSDTSMNPASVAETIHQLMALDRDILACCEEEKQACVQQLQQLTRGKNAADAYHDQRPG
ncbi:MAG: flagellar protein FliT [Gammaproteobacteria bacterium]